jgi:hypothetical protein
VGIKWWTLMGEGETIVRRLSFRDGETQPTISFDELG